MWTCVWQYSIKLYTRNPLLFFTWLNFHYKALLHYSKLANHIYLWKLIKTCLYIIGKGSKKEEKVGYSTFLGKIINFSHWNFFMCRGGTKDNKLLDTQTYFCLLISACLHILFLSSLGGTPLGLLKPPPGFIDTY